MTSCHEMPLGVDRFPADFDAPEPGPEFAIYQSDSNGVGRVVTDKLIESYLLSRKAQGFNRGTITNQRCALATFQAHIGNRSLDTLGPVHIEQWLESSSGLAPATRRSRLSAVRGFLRWCERRKYVKRNAAADIRGPRQPRTLPRALVGEAPEKVVAACPDARARLIVILMLQQGMRCVEVSRLELSDIDRFHGTVRVVGKGLHERVLPLMPETLECLDSYLLEYPCSAGPLIRSYRSWERHQALSAQAISKYVSTWMDEAGVKRGPRDGVSAHAGRHTCLSDMLRAGAHLRDVQAAAGHAHITSTEVYLPLLVNGLDAAMSGRSYGANRRP